MKITICSSLSFIKEMGEVASELRALGHEVFLPKSAAAVLRGEIALETIAKEKEDGTIVARAIKTDAIRLHYEEVKKGDVVLILNFTKKGITNYIGGNALMEMGFAHVLGKKIFLYNPIPEMIYTEEIKEMQPILIHQDLKKIQ